jgi:hypothetical protein
MTGKRYGRWNPELALFAGQKTAALITAQAYAQLVTEEGPNQTS